MFVFTDLCYHARACDGQTDTVTCHGKRSAATAQYVLFAGVTQANSAHVESIHRATPIKSVEMMFVRCAS